MRPSGSAPLGSYSAIHGVIADEGRSKLILFTALFVSGCHCDSAAARSLPRDGCGSPSKDPCVVQDAMPVPENATRSFIQGNSGPAQGSNAQFHDQS